LMAFSQNLMYRFSRRLLISNKILLHYKLFFSEGIGEISW
jgi:hypothetical protein